MVLYALSRMDLSQNNGQIKISLYVEHQANRNGLNLFSSKSTILKRTPLDQHDHPRTQWLRLPPKGRAASLSGF